MKREWKTRDQIAETYGELSSKAIRHNTELHKTNACLAEQARSAERAMERARYRR